MRVKKKLLIAILSLSLVLSFQIGFPCSMYKVTVGDKTMVGCNEDAWRLTSRIWFENATKKWNYGAGFSGSRFVGNNKFAPQSGMNEVGLAFSRLSASHPQMNLNQEGRRKVITDPDLYLKDILHTCKTVVDVKQYIERYDHSYFSEDVFIYIDKSGKYLIVEPYSLTIGNDPHYVLSNFCPSVASTAEARNLARFRNGEDYLKKNKIDTALSYCTALSDTMHVSRERNGDGTLLTSIWDLKDGIIHLFFYHNYDHHVQFNLADELIKGDHIIEIPTLFPPNSEFERLANYVTPFNTPFLRVVLVFLGGVFAFSSLFFLTSYFVIKKSEKYRHLKLTMSVLGIFLTYYMFVLATNIGVYYFDSPYQHYSSKMISISAYTPFLLLFLIIPLYVYNFKIIKGNSWSFLSKCLFTTNNIVHLILLALFVYWGLFSVFN